MRDYDPRLRIAVGPAGSQTVAVTRRVFQKERAEDRGPNKRLVRMVVLVRAVHYCEPRWTSTTTRANMGSRPRRLSCSSTTSRVGRSSASTSNWVCTSDAEEIEGTSESHGSAPRRGAESPLPRIRQSWALPTPSCVSRCCVSLSSAGPRLEPSVSSGSARKARHSPTTEASPATRPSKLPPVSEPGYDPLKDGWLEHLDTAGGISKLGSHRPGWQL